MNNIIAKDAQKLIEKGGITVIDVRTFNEYEAGHIKNAQNIDIQSPSFLEKIKTLDPNAEYIVNCERGGRSNKAVEIMNELGFSNVLNLEGGILAWRKERLPVERQ